MMKQHHALLSRSFPTKQLLSPGDDGSDNPTTLKTCLAAAADEDSSFSTPTNNKSSKKKKSVGDLLKATGAGVGNLTHKLVLQTDNWVESMQQSTSKLATIGFNNNNSSGSLLDPESLEESRQEALAQVAQHVQRQKETVAEMEKIINHTNLFVAARLESHNPMGAVIYMKQILKYERLKEHTLDKVSQLQQLYEQLQTQDDDYDELSKLLPNIEATVQEIVSVPEPCCSSSTDITLEAKQRLQQQMTDSKTDDDDDDDQVKVDSQHRKQCLSRAA